jgi:hypothetical protein
MSIDQISPVAAKPPAESLSVPDSARREVSLTEEADFAKTVQAEAPAKPDFSKATMEDVNKVMAEGVMNNLIDQMARQRQELKEAMEEQN